MAIELGSKTMMAGLSTAVGGALLSAIIAVQVNATHIERIEVDVAAISADLDLATQALVRVGTLVKVHHAATAADEDFAPRGGGEVAYDRRGALKDMLQQLGAPAAVPAPATDCHDARNTCADYAPSWTTNCAGTRCIEFRNSGATPIALAYQVGCNGDGTPGAPQCNCSDGPVIPAGGSAFWEITDGDYTSCLPSWTPACLTAGLAVLANEGTASCATGTRLEFTAGNSADPYGHADFYNIDTEKGWFAVPVKFAPDLACAVDHAGHNCRPLWCGDEACPDAYATPTTGGCPDGRSPQAACQDTFGRDLGYTVEFFPADCTAASCPSCQDAKACD